MTDTVWEAIRTLRVDQIGGHVAPPALRAAFGRHDRGEIDAGAYKRVEDEAVRGTIAGQEALGFPILTDGELRRSNFQESFANAVSGFDVPTTRMTRDSLEIQRNPNSRAEQNFAAAGPAILTRRRVVARLKLVRNVVLEEYKFAAAQAKTPVKVTLLGPDRIAQRFAHEDSTGIYKDIDDFLADVIAIERQMIAELVAAGCRYIQIDAPGYTAYVDPVSLDRMRARGEDPEANFRRSIDADNAVIAGFDDVVFGLHVCRGNPRTLDPKTGKVMPQWHREGYYDGIAERLFGGLKHQRLLLEYDTERAGSFAPLRFVPGDKIAVLGLVTTKLADLEPADGLRRRIDEAARYLPLDRLALSPQCGFGGMDPLHPQLTEAEQWAKFGRILETARSVWH